MSAPPRTGLGFAVVLMAFSWSLAVSGVAAPALRRRRCRSRSRSIVEAWQKAGAEVGWMRGRHRPPGNFASATRARPARYPRSLSGKWQDLWGAFGNGGGALGIPVSGGFD